MQDRVSTYMVLEELFEKEVLAALSPSAAT